MSDLKQKSYDEATPEIPTIINVNEHHMALIFVLDTSYSMSGPPIDQLNDGINRFKAEVCQDKQTRDILDVAIIQFNDNHSVFQDFVPIEYMETVNLYAEGSTKYTDAIRTAIQMVDDRSRFYRRSGTEPYKPWIIFVTDGAPLDDITAVIREVDNMQNAGKARFIALGVGDYDSDTLKSLTDVVFRMDGTDFTSFFNWVGKSMRSVSQSSPGEKPPLPPLEGNIYRDVSDI